jgi:hypothetical protein
LKHSLNRIKRYYRTLEYWKQHTKSNHKMASHV